MKPWIFAMLVIGTLVSCEWATAAFAPTLPEVQAPPRIAIPAVLHDDRRLQAKVTLALKDRPLSEALAELGKQIEVPLSAGAETADDKVTLFLDARPAAEVLALLARHFDFRWSRLFRGYELRQDSAKRAHEAALRRDDEAAEWSRLRAWIDRLDALLRTPREQLQVRGQEIADRLKDTQLGVEERSRLTLEATAIRDALRPETPAAVGLLRALTPPQVARLRGDGSLLLARKDGSLPARILEQVPKPPPDNPKDSPPEDMRTRPLWADAVVSLMEGGRGGTAPYVGERVLSLRFFVGLDNNANRRWEAVGWPPLIPSRERDTPVAAETDDPALTRLVELRLPPKPRPSSARTGGSASPTSSDLWPDWPTLGDVAEALHQATGLEILADSFVRDRVDPKWIADRQPVAKILETLSRELDCSWKKEGNLLLLRSRAYYWDRALAVPERVLRPWEVRAAGHGAVSLDALADLAAALNDDQALGMGRYWGWYLDEAQLRSGGSGYNWYLARRHLRFWAALNPSQKQQALAGAIVPVEQMSGAQRRAFVTALTDPFIQPFEPGAALVLSGRSPTPAELLSGGFSMKSVEWRYQHFVGVKPDGKTTEIDALHPASRPPILSNLPQGFQWTASGTPTGVDMFQFSYYLSGEQQPSRTAGLSALRPPTS